MTVSTTNPLAALVFLAIVYLGLGWAVNSDSH